MPVFFFNSIIFKFVSVVIQIYMFVMAQFDSPLNIAFVSFCPC